MAGRTQAAIYREIDLDLSWSEETLPQADRTKHVHGLHPYLGKFVPQLAEAFLRRCFRPGQRVLDPFMGSGTTLVEASVLDMDAVGIDISAFNCLLVRSRPRPHRRPRSSSPSARRSSAPRTSTRRARPHTVAGALVRAGRTPRPARLSRRRPRARRPCCRCRRIVLSRAARSARATTHFDLDFPREPATGEYWCHKHRRTCRPVDEAAKFLRRYTADTAARLRAYAAVRGTGTVRILHADSRSADPGAIDGILTSPPYPGLIDYHEQHRYAYELLGLTDRRPRRSAPPPTAARSARRRAYTEAIAAAFAARPRRCRPARRL